VVISADLGSSSIYSNESLFWSNGHLFFASDSKALKAVEEKVSLRVALMQRLVGPKCPEKSNKQ
jgi:hypothetical protein